MTKHITRAIIDKHSKKGALKKRAENRLQSAKRATSETQRGRVLTKGQNAEKVGHSESRMTDLSKRKCFENAFKNFLKKLKKVLDK